MRSFPPCYRIFTNFSHSKIEKNESITKKTNTECLFEIVILTSAALNFIAVLFGD